MGLFVTDTDAESILKNVLTKLQSDVGETLYPGDERRIFGESEAAIIVILFNTLDDAAKKSLLKYATGDILDAIGDSYDCSRLEADKANTTLRFSLQEVYPKVIKIPAGTRAATESGLTFITDEDAYIEAKTLSVDVEASAAEGGTAYNGLIEGSVATMVDLIAFVDSVTNATTTSGGTDKEKDDPYRERIRLRLSSFSTAGPANAYKYWAKSADNDVSDAYIESPSPNVINIYIAKTDGQLPDDTLIDAVQKVVNADDVRPLDDKVTTFAPETSNYDIELKYYVSSENESQVVSRIENKTYTDSDGATQTGVLEAYRLWQDTVIGRDINPDYLKKKILEAGADRVEVVSPAYTKLEGAVVAHFNGEKLTAKVTHEVYDDQ